MSIFFDLIRAGVNLLRSLYDTDADAHRFRLPPPYNDVWIERYVDWRPICRCGVRLNQYGSTWKIAHKDDEYVYGCGHSDHSQWFLESMWVDRVPDATWIRLMSERQRREHQWPEDMGYYY